MRRLTFFLVGVVTVSCGPGAAQVRSNRVQRARADAHQLTAPRQAQAYAEVVHAAHVAGDFKADPGALALHTADVIGVIDRAMPAAGVDAPTLVAWRGLMFLDSGQQQQALREFERSFQLGPNALAGRSLIVMYGSWNQAQRVGEVCAATVPVLHSTDDKLSLIALCRRHTNALSNEAEMAWMSPELVAWYQAENARRLGAEIDALRAAREQAAHQRRVVRQNEQCTATCKEEGLRCLNRCYGGLECKDRCVGINHACLDRCSSVAYEQLGY